MWNRWRSTRHRYFNPRPREGGRRPLVLREISIDEFQSTPPRGGATAMEDNKPADTWISIHAPARGGDAAYQLKIDALEISIHAPARGGDTSAADRSFTSRNFNPRPREGGRPPWRSSGPSRAHNFNPRPREGGDERSQMFQTVINAFQSTPPRGGRPVPLGPVIAITDISIHAPARGATYAGGAGSQSVIHFNPRPREGGDYHAYYYHTFQSQISIHAPARGATRLVPDLGQVAVISIHAPARGATSGNKSFLWVYLYFNPRPREGGDFPAAASRTLCRNFNPRPREGGDRGNLCVNIKKTAISIHAPARGATITWTTITPFCRHFNPRPREGGDLSAPWIA